MSAAVEEATSTARPVEARPSDRWASLAVWGILVAMTVVFLWHITRYGRNMPLSEDWNMVPPLAGEEPSFWSWVWSQNNEHRLPVARLVYLGLLEVTGDFRSGMVLNTLLVAALAAGLLVVVRRVRGRTSVVDAFFPILLLHLGHWSNLVWGWQLQFVFVAVLVVGLLLLLVQAAAPKARAVALIGLVVMLLPLGGGSALPMVPAAVAALAAVAWSPEASTRSRRIGVVASVVASGLVGFYFVNWEAATWFPDNPGPWPTLVTTVKALALGFGPGVSGSDRLAVGLVVAFLGSAVVLLLYGVRRGGTDRRRAFVLLLFLVGAGATALAVGYGRAALVPTEGLADRYVLVTVPALLAAWMAWQLFGPARTRTFVQAGLLAVVVLLLPLNTARGYEWRDWYTEGMDAVERDLVAGASIDEMVERHSDFLMHWNDDALADRMAMLQREGIGPFARLHVAAPEG